MEKIMDKKEEKTNNSNRNELVGKFFSKKKYTKKKISSRTHKIDMIETVDDKIQENVENVSVIMIICIIIICFVVGGALGYLLYDLAINNSDSLSMVVDIVNKI